MTIQGQGHIGVSMHATYKKCLVVRIDHGLPSGAEVGRAITHEWGRSLLRTAQSRVTPRMRGGQLWLLTQNRCQFLCYHDYMIIYVVSIEHAIF